MQKWELLILRGLELRPLGRPARSLSLYRLSYCGSNDKVVPILIYLSTILFKDWWRTEGIASALLISAPDGGERAASCSGRFFSRDKRSRYQLRTRLSVAQRQSGRCAEVTFLYRELNLDSAAQPALTATEVFLLLLIQPIASWIKELPSKTWSHFPLPWIKPRFRGPAGPHSNWGIPALTDSTNRKLNQGVTKQGAWR
jgi:hypothetical protein